MRKLFFFVPYIVVVFFLPVAGVEKKTRPGRTALDSIRVCLAFRVYPGRGLGEPSLCFT